MPSNYTEHYQLSQWEAGDRVQREDFNADNAKIDGVLGALQAGQLRMVVGSYIGTGTYGPDHPNVIEIPDAERPPRLVIVVENGSSRRGIFIRGMTASVCYNYSECHDVKVTWTDKGVRWYGEKGGYQQLNYLRPDETFTYYYVVFI